MHVCIRLLPPLFKKESNFQYGRVYEFTFINHIGAICIFSNQQGCKGNFPSLTLTTTNIGQIETRVTVTTKCRLLATSVR